MLVLNIMYAFIILRACLFTLKSIKFHSFPALYYKKSYLLCNTYDALTTEVIPLKWFYVWIRQLLVFVNDLRCFLSQQGKLDLADDFVEFRFRATEVILDTVFICGYTTSFLLVSHLAYFKIFITFPYYYIIIFIIIDLRLIFPHKRFRP